MVVADFGAELLAWPLTQGGHIVHHPFVVHVAGRTITGYGIALVIAFVTAWRVVYAECQRRGDEPEYAAEIVLAIAIVSFIGAKLSYAGLIGHGPLWTRDGHTFWGGLIGGTVGYACWARVRGAPLWRYVDSIGIAVAAGYSVGRTGCWAIGDDYGRPWDGFLGVRFPAGAPPSTAETLATVFGVAPEPGVDRAAVLPVHPTQLYEVALGLAMFVWLWRYRRHGHRPGWLFGMYCVLAGAERVIIEFFRVAAARTSFGMSVAQVIAVGVMAVGIALMYLRRAPLATSRHR
jgi:phosphatidylglycerol---prolipoprotein diacylglyceryl transferase